MGGCPSLLRGFEISRGMGERQGREQSDRGMLLAGCAGGNGDGIAWGVPVRKARPERTGRQRKGCRRNRFRMNGFRDF